MRRALSLERCIGAWGGSNLQKEAPSSSMKWESFLSKPRLLCYAFCKNTNLSESAELAPSVPTYGWLLPQTVTCRWPSRRASFAAISSTVSTFFRLICLLCENDEKTFPCWSNTSSIVARVEWERTYRG